MRCDLKCTLSLISPNTNEKVQMCKEEAAASLRHYPTCWFMN